MYNTNHVLDRLGLPLGSPTAVVVAIGERCRAGDMMVEASLFINMIVTEPRKYDDKHVAMLTAQALVEAMVRSGETFDPMLAIFPAEERARKFRYNPANRFLFEQDPGTVSGVTVTKQIGETSVEVKANGKIKKGGKQVAANALYIEHVVNGKKDNAAFLDILMTQLDMTKAGARTFMYNAKKAYENDNPK